MPNYKDFDLDLTKKKIRTNNSKDEKIKPNIARTHVPVKSCQYICQISDSRDCL